VCEPHRMGFFASTVIWKFSYSFRITAPAGVRTRDLLALILC
jgi:hypothetical protein